MRKGLVLKEVNSPPQSKCLAGLPKSSRDPFQTPLSLLGSGGALSDLQNFSGLQWLPETSLSTYCTSRTFLGTGRLQAFFRDAPAPSDLAKRQGLYWFLRGHLKLQKHFFCVLPGSQVQGLFRSPRDFISLQRTSKSPKSLLDPPGVLPASNPLLGSPTLTDTGSGTLRPPLS